MIVATAQSLRTRGMPEGVTLVVIDESHIFHQTHDAVLETLRGLKAEDKPSVTVFIKIDRIADPIQPRRLVADWPNSVAISATKGQGLPDLMAALSKQVRDLLGFVRALVPYSESALVQDCYDYGRVLKADYREDGIYIEAELVAEMSAKLERFSVPG